MEEKRCYHCGIDKELTEVKNATAITRRCDQPIKQGYGCQDCLDNGRIILK